MLPYPHSLETFRYIKHPATQEWHQFRRLLRHSENIFSSIYCRLYLGAQSAHCPQPMNDPANISPRPPPPPPPPTFTGSLIVSSNLDSFLLHMPPVVSPQKFHKVSFHPSAATATTNKPTSSAMIPSAGLYVPTGHSDGLPTPAAQYRPGGQMCSVSVAVAPLASCRRVRETVFGGGISRAWRRKQGYVEGAQGYGGG